METLMNIFKNLKNDQTMKKNFSLKEVAYQFQYLY